ncbi:MAG: DUF2178 domain-containing protein [Oscillospiraceae bacterium]|jgi:uncharacterized membrane protein HdeD (DUF308 family)|nr:DUF2178 domain-containing protein [Oscillospiraceae bacterium]
MKIRKLTLIAIFFIICAAAYIITGLILGTSETAAQTIITGVLMIIAGILMLFASKRETKEQREQELIENDERGLSIDEKAGNIALSITHAAIIALILVCAFIGHYTVVWALGAVMAVSSGAKLILRAHYRKKM